MCVRQFHIFDASILVANALLSVTSWITVINRLEVSPSSLYVNYNASKLMQLELY